MDTKTNILFDLGVVLLNIDYAPALRKAMKYCDGKHAGSPERFFDLIRRDSSVNRYERGDLSAREFYDHFVRITGFSGDFETFAAIWRDIFSENERMTGFGREISKDYRVYLASNASDLHVPYVFEAFPSLDYFSDAAFSFRLRASKPERAFYERAMKQFGVEPETCLFIDDRPENIKGAEQCGIRSILYTTPDETISTARALLHRE